MTPDHTRQEHSAARPTTESESTHSEDGVDLTLIRWMLSLTPAERLDVLQQHARAILKLREALEVERSPTAPQTEPPTE